ncbi:hypothetical protein ABEB36_013388 [Hypothenemus hampei]|uniref:Uncharacterized protein n=1 Tax=Hypothenemus hampei TaxID=57062 RepID=A0ABD1E822_HYPHA
MSVKSTLLIAMGQDAIFLNNIINDIFNSREEDISVKSWIRPWESSRNNNLSIKGLSYEEILEIIIDRMYILVNIFLEIMRVTPKKPKTLQPSRYSLGTAVQLFYKHFCEILADKMKTEKIACEKSINLHISDKNTQTEITTLTVCDSCNCAVTCIKRLLRSLKNEEQAKLKCQIFDITQFGCMLKVTSSIEESLHNLFTNLLKKDNDITRKMEICESLKKKLEEKDIKITIMEEEIDSLKRMLQKGSQKLFKLNDEKKQLSDNLSFKISTIDTLEQTINSLKGDLNESTNETEKLKCINGIMRKNVDSSIELLSKSATIFEEKIAKMNQEHETIKLILMQYEKSLLYLNVKLGKIAKHFAKIEIKLEGIIRDTNTNGKEENVNNLKQKLIDIRVNGSK